MRFFNTAGPVQCDRHYCLPPLERFNLDDVLLLIEQRKGGAISQRRCETRHQAILGEIAGRSNDFLRDIFVMEQWLATFEQFGEDNALNRMLTCWVDESAKPLVLI